MTTEVRPLTAKSSIGTWLKHPEGGPLIRELLAQGGFDENTLAPVRESAPAAIGDPEPRPAFPDRGR